MSHPEGKICNLENNPELLRRLTYMIGLLSMFEAAIYLGKLAEPITPESEPQINNSGVKRIFFIILYFTSFFAMFPIPFPYLLFGIITNKPSLVMLFFWNRLSEFLFCLPSLYVNPDYSIKQFSHTPQAGYIRHFVMEMWPSGSKIGSLVVALSILLIKGFSLYIILSFARVTEKRNDVQASDSTESLTFSPIPPRRTFGSISRTGEQNSTFRRPESTAPNDTISTFFQIELIAHSHPSPFSPGDMLSPPPDYRTAILSSLPTDAPPPDYDTAIRSQRVHL